MFDNSQNVSWGDYVKISVIGLGYVGVTTAACLAQDYETNCFDTDSRKINSIQDGDSLIYEPGLNDLVNKGVQNGKLKIMKTIQDAISNSNVTFICVGTPSLTDGHIDLNQVKEASLEVGLSLRSINRYHLVCVRSTMLPGTTINHVIPRLEEGSNIKSGKDLESV